ncbi:MAG: head-tail connector protein [Bacteroidaceae bacterium]|nr:head-tail connector protein [Bacteroidaceae bacterium]
MNIVTLEEVKAGLRIDEDYEDAHIENVVIPGATEAVRAMLRRTWENCYENFSEDQWAKVKNTIIMVCGDMLKHREMTSNQAVNANPVFRLMLCKLIKLTK